MNKLMKYLFPLAALVAMGSAAFAVSGAARAPKPTALVTTSAATLVTSGPGALYEVLISTGGANTVDFLTFRDSNTANTTSAPMVVRIPSSLTTFQQITFDPPLLFYNGLSADWATGSSSATVVFERGRGLNGQ